jgi:predicted ABC-type ATPase
VKTYTIIAGVNGVGKSSLTGVLKGERNDLGAVVDVNKIAADGKLGAIKAGKLAVAKIRKCLENDLSFTQETTLSGQRTEKTCRLAKERTYSVRLFYIGLNTPDESVKRIENRVRKGGHDIPTDDVIRRYGSRFDDLIKILPYCDEVHLYDNENGFVEVGEYKNGELIAKGDYKPAWLCALANTLKE